MHTCVLILCGKTPQILTETLYKLIIEENVDVCSVWAITTKDGKDALCRKLLHDRNGWYYRFCREFALDPKKLGFDQHHIITAGEQEDLLDKESNAQFADAVVYWVQKLTSEKSDRLYACIAGGRKTMSAYFAMAMQFFARPVDRMFHLVINPASMENHPDFYYPPKTPIRYNDRNQKTVDSRDILLNLFDVPFLRLRERLLHLFGCEPISYSEMIARAQEWMEQPGTLPPLILIRKEKRVRIGQWTDFVLRDFDFALLLFLAEKNIQCPDASKTKDPPDHFLAGGKKFEPDSCHRLAALYGEPKREIQWDEIQQAISRIRRKLKQTLPVSVYNSYTITKKGTYFDRRYGLLLHQSNLVIL